MINVSLNTNVSLINLAKVLVACSGSKQNYKLFFNVGRPMIGFSNDLRRSSYIGQSNEKLISVSTPVKHVPVFQYHQFMTGFAIAILPCIYIECRFQISNVEKICYLSNVNLIVTHDNIHKHKVITNTVEFACLFAFCIFLWFISTTLLIYSANSRIQQ